MYLAALSCVDMRERFFIALERLWMRETGTSKALRALCSYIITQQINGRPPQQEIEEFSSVIRLEQVGIAA